MSNTKHDTSDANLGNYWYHHAILNQWGIIREPNRRGAFADLLDDYLALADEIKVLKARSNQ